MIIGLKYSDVSKSFENSMIDLIHGDVIDADGLDYVCRDASTSGYKTNNIDCSRLISSIRIVQDPYKTYKLCYTVKSLNEIESVLRVKTFQQSNVITHHTVTYEQKLLVKAMESAALYQFDQKNDEPDDVKRKMALEKICDIKSFYNIDNPNDVGILTSKNVKLAFPMDDDFISLMKCIPDDKYVEQWFSRKYLLKPLWKSKAEFYFHFENLRNAKLTDNTWIFHKDCQIFISEEFEIPETDIWIIKATPKYKLNYAKKVLLYVNDEVIEYQKLFPNDVQSYEPPLNEFYYIYVPCNVDKNLIIERLKEKVAQFHIER